MLFFFFFKTLLWNLEMDNLNLSILEYTDKVLKKEKKNMVSDSEKSYAVAMFTILSIQKI